MACYKFTYKDVLKRYERIINKPSKFEIRLLATILLIITIVNITSLCFAYEEEPVTFDVVTNLGFDANTNHFVGNLTNRSTGYFQVEKGYNYFIQYGSENPEAYAFLATSSEIPANNVPLDYIGKLFGGETYSYIGNSNEYVYFTFSNTYQISVTRQRIEGQEGAVSDLVENVGISQIWDIFDTGIGFVGVVVLFAFGIFLIVLAVKKVSKGKSDF